MGLSPVGPNAYYGVVPGSQQVPLGGSTDARYGGMMSLIDPGKGIDQNDDYLTKQQKYTTWDQQNADYGRKTKLYDQFLDNMPQQGYGSGNYNFQSWGQPVPAPSYASTAGIWSQGQINDQANIQRAQLMAQAANQSRGYATHAAAAGFSPMSPLTSFMQQTANQHAGAAAAANTTNLNFTAAQGNREASQRGESINAGLYGSYTNALARQREMALQAQQQQFAQRNQQYQILSGLLGR